MTYQQQLISQIGKRAMWEVGLPPLCVVMDITCLISGGLKIDLEGLLKAKPLDFAHDIAGIHDNLNRETRSLDNFFLPRYAKPE